LNFLIVSARLHRNNYGGSVFSEYWMHNHGAQNIVGGGAIKPVAVAFYNLIAQPLIT